MKPSHSVIEPMNPTFLERWIVNVIRDCKTSQEVKCDLETKRTSVQPRMIDGATLDL
jgi:hypothetical protein